MNSKLMMMMVMIMMITMNQSNIKPTNQIPYFEDVGVVTLIYLDLLVQKDNLQKSQFFKDLTPVVTKLPKVV